MRRPGDQKLRELLVACGLLEQDQSDAVFAACEPANAPGFLELAAARFQKDERFLLEAVAAETGMPLEELDGPAPPIEALKIVPARLAEQYRLLPLRVEDAELVVAVSDPFDALGVEDVKLRTGMEVRPVLASDRDLGRAIRKAYAEPPPPPESASPKAEPDTADYNPGLQMDAVKIFNFLVLDAVKRGAGAIHIDPQPGTGTPLIRLRMPDRSLVRWNAIPAAFGSALISRIKIMAELDISERRRPQDGKMSLKSGERVFDIACFTVPTAAGESVNLVIMEKNPKLRSLLELGAPPELSAALRRAFAGGGLILAGAGELRRGNDFLKTLAREANAQERVVVAVTSSPEGLPEGAIAIRINVDIGLNFASAIHAGKRHDPDLMIVEILRDEETAKRALDCAEDGIAVLVNIPTAGAADAVTRLLDMGVDRAQLARTLRLAIYQHPLRRRGREELPLYELLEKGPALERALAQGADGDALRRAMAACGLKSFREQARALLDAGEISAVDLPAEPA